MEGERGRVKGRREEGEESRRKGKGGEESRRKEEGGKEEGGGTDGEHILSLTETKTQDCSRTMFDSVDTIVQKGPLIRPQRYSNGFVWRSR